MRCRYTALLLALLLASCAPQPPVVIDPPAPPPEPRELPDDIGRASFFLPVEIPLATVRGLVEASVPRQLDEEQQEDYSPVLTEESWRLLATRGGIDVGFAADRFIFRFPVAGRIAFAGRLRPVPVGRGVPVHETVDFSGVDRIGETVSRA